MTEPMRHRPDDPRLSPQDAASGDPPFDRWEELFAELEERAAPALPRERPDELAVGRRIAAWALVDEDVAAVGLELGIELALAANSRRPSPLLSAVGRLVDADPADLYGQAVYLTAFRKPVIRLALYLGRRSGSDAASFYEAVQDDLLQATHELVVFGMLFSGAAVLERTRVLGLARLRPHAAPLRLALRGLLGRCVEAVESAMHDLLGPGLVDRVSQRLVPLDAVLRLQAMVEDGVAFEGACRTLGLWRRAARRQLAGYRTVRSLYEAESARLSGQIAALENGRGQ